MNLKFHSSVLFVNDIEKSKSFYRDILNLKIETDFGNNVMLKGGLSLWQIQEKHIIKDCFYNANDKNKSLELYFETEDINQVKQLVENNNIRLFHDIIEESWGQKTIRFFDPDDNLIEVGEKLDVFLKRLFEEGLTIEQVHKKTGVPLAFLNHFISK